MHGLPRPREVVGQTRPGAEGAERTEDGPKAVIGVALSEGMILGERGGGLFVVPERDHHGGPHTRGAFAGERNRDRRTEPSQPGDVRKCWSAPQGPQRASGAEVGNVDGCNHRTGASPPLGARAHRLPVLVRACSATQASCNAPQTAALIGSSPPDGRYANGASIERSPNRSLVARLARLNEAIRLQRSELRRRAEVRRP